MLILELVFVWKEGFVLLFGKMFNLVKIKEKIYMMEIVIIIGKSWNIGSFVKWYFFFKENVGIGSCILWIIFENSSNNVIVL